MRCNTDGRLCLAKFIFRTFLVQYEQCDQEITILSLSLKAKKHLLCILLIVLSLIFVWRQRSFLLIRCVYCSFSLCVSHLSFLKILILVCKHIYRWQKPQGWWSVAWDGKKWNCLHMLICSFAHFYFYVNIYSFINSVNWCLKYQKKILPQDCFYISATIRIGQAVLFLLHAGFWK